MPDGPLLDGSGSPFGGTTAPPPTAAEAGAGTGRERRNATPMPSSAQVAGSIAKPA